MSKELNSGEGERMVDKMSEIDLSDWVKSGKPLSEYKADIADREKYVPLQKQEAETLARIYNN